MQLWCLLSLELRCHYNGPETITVSTPEALKARQDLANLPCILPQSGLQSLASIRGMHFLGVQTCTKHLPAADIDLRLYPGSVHVPTH